MTKVKVGVAGYGTIGQRLADGVALQKDMELVGVADLLPTLSIRALKERGMPYDVYLVDMAMKEAFDAYEIPVKGSFEDLVKSVDVMLDSSPAGVGLQNKKIYEKYGVKAIFQGGEKDDVADVFFHGLANFEKGVDQNYLKLTSCNTTGLVRAVNAIDEAYGVDCVSMTIIRRVADPGDYHRGLTNALEIEKAPSHQALDLMKIMPHVKATGILVHTPVTHGHIIVVDIQGKKKITKDMALEALQKEPRIMLVTKEEGFKGNASFYKYAREIGRPRGDFYPIGVWKDSILEDDDRIMFAIYIPQESITIPETIDGIRAIMHMHNTKEEAVQTTNQYLGIHA